VSHRRGRRRGTEIAEIDPDRPEVDLGAVAQPGGGVTCFRQAPQQLVPGGPIRLDAEGSAWLEGQRVPERLRLGGFEGRVGDHDREPLQPHRLALFDRDRHRHPRARGVPRQRAGDASVVVAVIAIRLLDPLEVLLEGEVVEGLRVDPGLPAARRRQHAALELVDGERSRPAPDDALHDRRLLLLGVYPGAHCE
jgi:hypothetical protein